MTSGRARVGEQCAGAAVWRLIVLCAVTAGLGFAALPAGPVPWHNGGLLVLAVLACELRVVHLGFGAQRWTFTITELPLCIALVVAPGRWIVVAVALAVLAAQLIRRTPTYKRLFNVAQFGAAAAAATAVTLSVPGIGGPALGMVAFWLVNLILMASVLHLSTGIPLVAALRSSAPLSVTHTTAVMSLGLLTGHLVMQAPGLLPALVVPVCLIAWSLGRSGRQESEARAAQVLVSRSADRVQNPAAAAESVARAAIELVAAPASQVLLAHDGCLLHVALDADGTRVREVGTEALQGGWQSDLLEGRARHTGVDADGRSWVGIRLEAADGGLLALVRVLRDAGEEPPREDELRALESLQVAATMLLTAATAEVPDTPGDLRVLRGRLRSLGELGGTAGAMLSTLNAAGARIDDLAAALPLSEGAQAAGVAEDLRAVERSLSSLVGALLVSSATPTVPSVEVAAAEPIHRVVDLVPPAPRTDTITAGSWRGR